ncbi:MAG: hypothetical protein Q7T55_00655 [Solirubrobacteraceae bacterium]|nr:hypothetical protein [Solirubrobacteraceae bacterium]
MTTMPLPTGDAETTLATWATIRERGWLSAATLRGRGEELQAVREVASEDIALGRIFDGHRNALERLLAHRAADVDHDLRLSITAGDLALGVWGADPGPDDGPPAVLSDGPDGPRVDGVKTFCSGSGLVDQAIVLVRRSPTSPPILPVLVDLTDESTVTIDRSWFKTDAVRESRSDRVVFDGARVLAVLGKEGTLSEDPWISGDALRSTAVWAGGADAVLARLLHHAVARPGDAADEERLGRASAILATIDVWLAAGLAAVEAAHEGGPSPAPTIAAMRLELSNRIRELLALAAELGGSRALVADGKLAAARAGLDVLLLQHRLGPVAARRGRAAAAEAAADAAGVQLP